MVILFLSVLCVFVFVITIRHIVLNTKVDRRNFYINRNHTKYNVKSRLVDIVEKKLNKIIKLNKFVDNELFDALGLVYAPVYLVRKDKIGLTHLKLYEKIFEKVKSNCNFVVVNGKVNINNKQINCVSLEYDKLTYNQIALLNCLNVNKKEARGKDNIQSQAILKNKINKFNQVYFYNFNGLSNIEAKITKESMAICLQENSCLYFYIPVNPFGYILKKSNIGLELFDVFKKKVLEIVTTSKVILTNNVLKFEAKEENLLKLKLSNEVNNQIFDLLDLNICYLDFEDDFNYLKEEAKQELNKNIFLINQKIVGFKVENLKDFFKIAKLRKNYFNDYIFLLTDVLGIKIINDILTIKPKPYINQDFVISYLFDGKFIDVKFSKTPVDKISLAYVGHKIGVSDKFIYNY